MTQMPGPARAVLVFGLLILSLALTNIGIAHAVTPELLRAEVLAGLSAVILMLVAVLWTRANPRSSEQQELMGEQGLNLANDLPAIQQEELAWGSHMLLTATPAATVLIFWQGRVILRRGLLGDGLFSPGPISCRAMTRQTTVSLVKTALFPGRAEFDPVLEGLPAVMICPLGGDGVIVLGGWSERCFSRSDELWLQGWAERLKTSLEQVSCPVGSPSQVSPST